MICTVFRVQQTHEASISGNAGARLLFQEHKNVFLQKCNGKTEFVLPTTTQLANYTRFLSASQSQSIRNIVTV